VDALRWISLLGGGILEVDSFSFVLYYAEWATARGGMVACFLFKKAKARNMGKLVKVK
jgi:hypothetical protein